MVNVITYSGTANFRDKELSSYRFIKIRTSHKCDKCFKTMNKSSYCWGRYSRRYCLSCRDIIFENLKQAMRDFIKVWKIEDKKYSEVKDEYINNNMLASL